VAALDVGRGQLDWTLRRDPRVRVVDGLNARHLRPEHLPFAPSIAVVDVSFISLELVLPGVMVCLTEPGEVVALIKPQFEVGRRQVGPGGIVRDPLLHADVLEKFARMAHAHDWGLAGVCAAAVRGAEGNQEYCIHVTPTGGGMSPATVSARIRETVDAVRESSA
jgi:23S rRNA (cytidine1920-2'-O)/16S rRNA (cytidine1409-2'-O)-methyltransferase